MDIAIVDDHYIVRKGLIEILHNLGNFNIVIEAQNGSEFIEKYKRAQQLPEICIIDIQMPEMNRFELVEYIAKNISKLRTLILTTYNEEYFLIKMIKLGVNGYLLKDCHPNELKLALESISENSFYFNNIFSKRLKKLVDSNFIKLPKITDNEKEFLEMCGEDLTYGQIAQRLNKSQRSIEGYRDSLFNKFEVNNRASLVLLAIKLGIIKL